MSNEVIICPDVGLKFIFKPKIDLKGGPGRGVLVNNNCSSHYGHFYNEL